MRQLLFEVCCFTLLIVLAGCGDQGAQERAETSYAEARRQAEAGRYLRAIAACQQALDEDSTHLGALLLAGSILQKQGNFELAVEQISRAVRLYPDTVRARTALGDVYMRERQNHSAAVAYEEAILLAPDHGYSYRHLALVLTAQGRYDDAAAALTTALRLEPENPANHYNLGLVYEQQAHTDSAIAAYSRTVSSSNSCSRA